MASEWRQERERAHADIMVEVAALGRAQVAGPQAMGNVSLDEQGDEVMQATVEGAMDETMEHFPEAQEAEYSGETGAARPPGDLEQHPGAVPQTEIGPEQVAAAERGAQAPPLAGIGNDAHRQHASLMRTWCAKLGTAVAIQGVVQFLAGRVSFDEVALWRMQTASCAWHSGRWDDIEANDDMIDLGHSIAPSLERSQQRAVASRGARVLRFLTGGWNCSWKIRAPDSATVAARRDWSRDLHDDAFEIVAANSFIWNRALRPIIGIGMAQLLCAHCPKQLWAKIMLLAIPILRHPLKVVSLRLVCPGWPPPSFWQLILDTLDGPSKMSPMAGILPKICSHFLIAQLRSLHLDEKIRLLFMQVSSVGARAMRSRARSGAEQVPAPDQPQSDGTGGRQRDVADRDRGVQRGAARGGDRHLAWAASVSGPLQRVVAAMFEELLVATVTYPLVVLERRMCVDLNAPSNPFSLPSNLLYTYRLIRVEGWSALTVAYPEAMLVTVGKFSIYCTQLSIEEIVSRWFGPFGRLMLPAASAALAAGSNALRTMSSSHIKRAPWNSVLSVMLWMECGALASCYKQLGNPFVHLDQQGQRALRFWGWGGANSGEGRNRGLRLPLVRFRSDEARAQWFSTAYGSLDALSERAAAHLAPETSVGSTWSGGVHRRSETHAPGEPTDTYLQRSFPTMEPARVRDIASQDSGMIRSTGMPSMFSEVRSESDTFERMGNTKHVVSRWGRQRPSGRPLPELRTIVTQQAPYTSSNKVVMDSCAGTELARTMWSLRTLQLRSPEFSRNLPLSLTVDPDDVLASSFALLESLPAEVLVSRPIFVRFKGQIGSDWGGVRRAWMAKLASELFDPGLGLVIPCSVLSASTGVSPTGNITINPAPELLYTDQSASKSKITREEKREEKRENLRALLEGERRGIRDRDRERRRDTLSVQASVCGGGSASRPDASERAAAAGGACDAATLMAAAAEDNGECRDHRNESGDWSACAADACSESCVRDEASESDMDRGTERPVDDVTGGHMPGGIVEVAREDADVVSAECRQEGSLDSTIAPPGPAAAGGSASEAFAAGEGGQFIGGDGEARDAGSAGGEVIDVSEKKGGSSNEGAVKDKSITDRYLRFMGRVLGIALLSGDPLGVNLDSAFFHSLLSREPLRIVLLGPPGCGKSLQCNLLASRCRLRHVTLDRLVRWHSTHNTREFKELKKLLRSANLRSTSARAAAEGLLLALHPPERAASPFHDKEDAALRGDGAHKSQASARTEERMFRKAHEIVLGMLKTRLAPRRRAGDKGWVLEGLPHCVSLAGELWDLGESCQPNLVVALHPPQKQRNEGGPLPESHVSPLSRPCSPDTVAQPDAVDRDLDARMVDDAGAAKGSNPSTGPISASVEQFGNVSMSCENCRNDLEFGQKICSFCGDPAPRAWPASCGEDDDLTGDGQKFGRQCGAEAQGGAGGAECHNLPSSCDAASELESCREPVLAEGVEATPTQDRHTVKNKLSDFSNTLGEHAGGAEACGAKARRRPHDAQMAEAGERDPVDPRREKGQRVDECRKRTVLEEHYARNIWGVLDFYHSHTVTCAMINQASHDIRDELEVDGDQSNHLGAMTSHSGGDDVKDDEALLSTDSTSGAIGLTDGRTLRDEDMEAGPGRSWFLDGWAEGGMDDDDWVQVNREGLAEGSSSATASVAAAGQACCGNVPGGELSVQHRTHSACRNNNLDFGGSTERRFGCGQRASYMSPPHLHKEIMRVAGLVQWGAPGVSEPGLAELAQTDPDEYEKLQRLLSMDKNECAAWLEAGDMPFTTATKEARVAPSVGLPLSALDRLDTAPLGGYTPHDRVTPETVSDYAALVCHRRMVEDVAHQMAQIRHGFEELAPRLKLGKMITARELETVLVGSADVDVSDWRQHSVAKGFTASAPQVEWFWEVLKEASAETRLRILTWTTGLARAPLGGFAHMHLAFTLQCDPAPEHADRLPVAHTCGLQLDLPLYASKEVLCSKLLQAVQHVDFQIA